MMFGDFLITDVETSLLITIKSSDKHRLTYVGAKNIDRIIRSQIKRPGEITWKGELFQHFLSVRIEIVRIFQALKQIDSS